MAGLIVSAGIVEGQLILGLSDGQVIRAGIVQGPQGLRGEPGSKGDTGRPGQDGNTVHHSAGRPRPDLGRDGDHHVNTIEWEWSIKENGVWGKPQPLLAERANPTGALSQQDRLRMGGGRFFPIGGAGSSVTVPSATQGGLERIIGYGQPLGANTWSAVALDADGDLMECTLYFSRAGGNEVYVAKVIAFRANTLGNLTVAWEAASPDTLSYVVDFDAPVVGSELTLRIRSNTNWEVIRGVVSKL